MRRRGAVVALVGVLAVLAGCGDGSPDDPADPRGVVEALKDALVDADAEALREVLSDELRRTSVSDALLTDDVLAEGALAGQDVEVDKTDNSSLEFIEYELVVDDTAWLEVSVSRGGTLVTSTLPKIEAATSAATGLSVNGVAVPVPAPEGRDANEPSRTFFMPPGRFDVGVLVPKDVVTATPPQEVVLDVDAPPAVRVEADVRLTDVGRDQVDRAVRAWVRDCTEPRRGPRDPSCPASKAWVGAELVESRWAVDGTPTWTVEETPDGFQVQPERTPTARMTGTIRDRATGRTEAVSDEAPLAVSGTVRLTADGLQIDVPGS